MKKYNQRIKELLEVYESNDIYNDDKWVEKVESDEMTDVDAGFMLGWEEGLD